MKYRSDEVITQDIINKMHNNSLSRRNNKELAYDRYVHNEAVQLVILELSDCGE